MKLSRSVSRTVLRAATLSLALAGGVAPALQAQAPDRVAFGGREAERESQGSVASEALARNRYFVVIDLDENRLLFAKGRQVLWSAPVGTGTGLLLRGEEHGDYDFRTPNGVFQVKHKALDPVWIAPDWWFVENGLPVPARDSERRRFPGGLGAAAVYLGDGIAIHGTDKPELLGQRVSHGCIRLANHDALRLFHNVQLGTEIIVVGGPEHPTGEIAAGSRTPTSSGGPRPDPIRDEIVALETGDLLDRLDTELVRDVFAPGESKWPLAVNELLKRGLADDDRALAGVLARYATLGRGRLRTEYATVLADTYSRGTLRTLEMLGGLQSDVRREVASGIVAGTIGLYPHDEAERIAPWPTRRVPRERLDRRARNAWDALSEAEDAYRRNAAREAARSAD